MKFLVVIAAFVTCAAAKPGGFAYSTFGAHPYAAYHHLGAPALHYAHAPALHYASAPAVVAPAFHKTQYHAQDELGQASHGYAYPGQAHAVVRDAAGNERGSYAYVNPEGQEIRVDYTAGHNGFQVASNALPVAPVHVAAPLGAPLDTPEVAAAKVQHAHAHAEALARSHLRKKRGVVAAPLAAVAPVATYHSTPAATALTAYGAPALHYAHAPALHYAAAPALAAPALHYAAAPALAAPAVHYAAAPALAAPALAYAAPAHAVRVAELTKIVNNPGHAVSYRVD